MVRRIRRTNTFTFNPGKEEAAILNKWADDCARMYNEINYKRRQSFFYGKAEIGGKQGRLEIVYDPLEKRWKAYMPVECEAPHKPKGEKIAFVDLGVKCPIMAEVDGRIFGKKSNAMIHNFWSVGYQYKQLIEKAEEMRPPLTGRWHVLRF